MNPIFLLGVTVCLFASGCDSKNPLSDPKTSKADERLAGIWRYRSSDEVGFYHVGHAGDKFPASMMRAVFIKHKHGEVSPPVAFLLFPTVIGDKTYLNAIVVMDDKLRKNLDEKGWNAAEVESYTFYKYRYEGDKLLLYGIDNEAKRTAIKSGKVKGTLGNSSAMFTDTTENLARFIAEAGDSLWEKESGRLELVKFGEKQ